MLSENIKTRRKAKGLSQEELALRLHVVRQTISKWEQGLSVPDADLLLALSQALDTPVSDLLGETLPQPEAPDLQELSQRLEAINLQLARGKAARRKGAHLTFLTLCFLFLLGFVLLAALGGNPALSWDYSDPETAVAGTILHGAQWVYARAFPFLFAASALGAFLTRRKS
jgi:putative transcriptional regulator